MSFGGSGGGGGKISTSGDVFLSNPANGDVLGYDAGLWKNIAPSISASFTAAKNTAASGNITLTSGTSAQLLKFAATLTANRTITLAGVTANAYFDLSFIETNFNGYTITISDGAFFHAFSNPTYVRYVYISGSWERVL